MRVGIRLVIAASRIITALLLGVMLVALVMPSGRAAPAQTQALLFTAIDLNPSGFSFSVAEGISGGQQVGFGFGPATGGRDHALLWRGSAASVVDLHPPEFTYSEAHAICGDKQVGNGSNHALLWRGSAASVVDLHPSGVAISVAQGVSGGEQVGSAPGECCGVPGHALLWRGTAASVVDLHPHPSDFSDFEALGTWEGQQVGWGSVSVGGGPGHAHALLWRGSAASEVDLHPSGFTESRANGVSDEQQVGEGVTTEGFYHALLWRGTAASVMDLNPSGFGYSKAHATNGKEQVGEGDPKLPPAGFVHALLWSGGASRVVDLHTFLPPGFVESRAWGIDETGDVVGEARITDLQSHAFLWKRNISKPGTSRVQNALRCQP